MTPAEREMRARTVVADFAAAFWRDRTWQMEQTLLDAQVALSGIIPPASDEWFARGLEPQAWLYMARAGLGLIEPTDAARAVVHETCQSLAEWLFAVPGDGHTIPDSWYETEMGGLWAAALLWAEGDELVTLAEASRLSGVPLTTLASRVERGSLRAYVDPTAAARQGRRLVRRRDVPPGPDDDSSSVPDGPAA